MDTFEKARQTALRILTSRPRTVYELRKKLEGKGVAQPLIENAIAYCLERGYLDDAKLARDWIAWRLEGKPAGKLLLRLELRERGIDEVTIEAALMEQYADQNEFEYALKAARKKSPVYRSLNREIAQQRLRSFLSRRGFSSGTVGEVIDHIFDI